MDKSKNFTTYASLFIGGLLVGLTVSKFSARVYYDWGFNTAVNNQEKACVAWWFQNSAIRVKQAQHFACGKG